MLPEKFPPLFFLLFICFPITEKAETPYVPEDTLVLKSRKLGSYIIENITPRGNKVTKSSIILRELTFSVKDTLSIEDFTAQLQKSKENLLNTSLFNFVEFDIGYRDSVHIDIVIHVVERWYTWPVPIFEIAERNFNTWWLTRDFSRANYGFYLTRDNFRGRKESLTLKCRFGYNEQYGISYQIPYFNRRQRSGLGFAFYLNRTHEIPYGTVDNKLVFYKDEGNYVREEITSRISYTNRQGFYNNHLAELRYFKGYVSDTVLLLTNNYFIYNKPTMEHLTLYYVFRRDCRDSKAYPLKGYFLDLSVTKHGLALLKNEDLDVWFLEGGLRKYWKVSNRVYLASSIKGRFSPYNNQPYYVQRALGYNDYVRAYEYYVIDGQSFALFKSAVRYEIIKPRISKLPLIKTEKFKTFHYALYIGAFSDMGYVENKNVKFAGNNMSNSFLSGSGVGVDFVTYYDNVIRFEYSLNRLGESGIFVHFATPL